MKTLYFNGDAGDNTWDTLGNWFQDNGSVTPAASLPVDGDIVYIGANVFSGPTATLSLLETHITVGGALYSQGSALNFGHGFIETGGVLSSGTYNFGDLDVNYTGQINNAVVVCGVLLLAGAYITSYCDITCATLFSSGNVTVETGMVFVSGNVTVNDTLEASGSSFFVAGNVTNNAGSYINADFSPTFFVAPQLSISGTFYQWGFFETDSAAVTCSYYFDTVASSLSLNTYNSFGGGYSQSSSFQVLNETTVYASGFATGQFDTGAPQLLNAQFVCSKNLHIKGGLYAANLGTVGAFAASYHTYIYKRSVLENTLKNSGMIYSPVYMPADILGTGFIS